MKTKKLIDPKLTSPVLSPNKPKSLRPMRSMVAVRSLKSKTAVASFATKAAESAPRT